MSAVVELLGGPAGGRRLILNEEWNPPAITVPAAEFGGYVDAEYRPTGGAHSIGASADVHTYAYRLPDGRLDFGQSVDDKRFEEELDAQFVQLQPVSDGKVTVLYLDGPAAGTFDRVAAENGKPPEEVDTKLGNFLNRSLTYVSLHRTQIRDRRAVALYVYKP